MQSTDSHETAREARGRRTARGRGAVAAGWLAILAVAVGAGVGVGTGLSASKRAPHEGVALDPPWRGRLVRIASGAVAVGGVTASEGDGARRPLAVGAAVDPGVTLRTDARTRARVDLDDGKSRVVIDRASALDVVDVAEKEGRALRLRDGVALFDVARGPSRVLTPRGALTFGDAALTVSVTPDQVSVEVLRGAVDVRATTGETVRVDAAHEAVLDRSGTVDVVPSRDLAARAAFADDAALGGAAVGDGARTEAHARARPRGLGELRARRPGHEGETERAVALASHAVRVRIAGAVARTEVDETFRNDTADELEGIYRFPLPEGAQIQRLALEVDGKLVDGAFVDAAKASAIWRGAIHNAAPLASRPHDEIVWVPGPWKDPALLEWRAGGHFELRIFPIPKHGARRVVIAYTETLALRGGQRHYTYPLAEAGAGTPAVGRFDVDVQVLGASSPASVRLTGYAVGRDAMADARAVRFEQSFRDWTPSGDLGVDLAAADDEREASAWAYRAAGGREAFLAVALRPRMPSWEDGRARDLVLVVDAGRAMFGERLGRARRVAVGMAQQMDRRDRLSVLACDLTCRTMPGGFHAPGSAAAHDVDAFLAGITADGATDLVGAVAAAARAPGRDGTRDLRVVLLGGGAPSAGYADTSRLAAETRDALGDAGGALVAVAIGGDDGTRVLAEMARGGAGVVVPDGSGVSPAEASRVSLDALAAAHGRALTDVEVTMPPGVTDVAGHDLAPLRVGGEAIVVGRVAGDRVAGDVVVRGKLGGDPFERRYAIDANVSDDAANAFVPRLFAAARIADAERAPGAGGPGTRAEIVALSARYAVPSRFTSLLVLESEAMFRAFAIDRTSTGEGWTGEAAARGADVVAAGDAVDDGPDLGSLGAMSQAAPSPARAPRAATDEARAATGGGAPSALDRGPAPAPTSLAERMRPPPPIDEPPWPRTPRGQWMKRIWTRHADVRQDASPVIPADGVATARAALDAAPDDRARALALAAALSAAGRIDELAELTERESSRDPLDPDLIALRADVAVARGDRDGARRIASGMLASAVARGADVAPLAARLARAFERAADPAACPLRVTVAEARHADADAVARAVACERARGAARAADRWLDGQDPAKRADISARAAKLGAASPEVASGDVVIDASWDPAALTDLDLVLVDARGRRLTWSTDARSGALRVADPRGRSHESLALGTLAAGAYSVEVARSAGASGPAVHGQLALRAYGSARSVPFTLDGARAAVLRFDVRWTSALVPVTALASTRAFDPAVARRALDAASLVACRDADGAVASGLVRVTFEPGGHVAATSLDGIASGSAAVGQCVARLDHAVTVPPFDPGAGPPPVILHRYIVR
jgi:hypothetical protein